MMKKELLKSIRANEGYRREIYLDHLGKPTIGIGFLVKYLTLTEEESMMILERYVDELIDKIQKKFDWFEDIHPKAQMVLIELAYQIGISGVSKFKLMLKAMSECSYIVASNELLDSKLAREDTPARAKRLADVLYKLG